MKKAITLLASLFICLVAIADDNDYYYFGGTIGNHPIVIAMRYNMETGVVSGKYAYISTLKKNGKKANSYLYFSGTANISSYSYELENAGLIIVKDSQGKTVERWTDASIDIGNRVTCFGCDVHLDNGKTLELSAEVDNSEIPKYF